MIIKATDYRKRLKKHLIDMYGEEQTKIMLIHQKLLDSAASEVLATFKEKD